MTCGVGAADCGRLLELLSLVPDPRCRRGVRHTIASILAIAAAAVLAGCTSVLAIGEWAAEAPQALLAPLSARQAWPGGCYLAPHVATFRRVLRDADANAADAVIGSFLAEVAGFASLASAGGDQAGPPGPAAAAGSRSSLGRNGGNRAVRDRTRRGRICCWPAR